MVFWYRSDPPALPPSQFLLLASWLQSHRPRKPVSPAKNPRTWQRDLPHRSPSRPMGAGWRSSTPLGIYQYHLNSLEQAWFYPLPASPSDLRFSPAGDRLAFSDGKGTIRILRPDTGQTVAGMQAQQAGTLAWAPDGQRLVSAGGCQTVIVWDAANGAKLRQLRGDLCSEGYSEIHAAWSADGKTIYAALAKPIAWDAKTYEPRADFSGTSIRRSHGPGDTGCPGRKHADFVRRHGWACTQRPGWRNRTEAALTGCVSGHGFWRSLGSGRTAPGRLATKSPVPSNRNAATGQVLKKLDGFLATPGIAWLPDGRHLAGLTCMDGSLCIVDSETGQTFKSLKDHTVAASYMTWTSNGLLSISGLGLTSWDPKTGQSIQQSQVGSAQAWVSSWPASGPRIFLYSQSNGQAQVGDGQEPSSSWKPARASILSMTPGRQMESAWRPEQYRTPRPAKSWSTFLLSPAVISQIPWPGLRMAVVPGPGDSLYMGPVTIVNLHGYRSLVDCTDHQHKRLASMVRAAQLLLTRWQNAWLPAAP